MGMSQTALVTGASSGIGLELARYHAEQGGDLVIVARREDRLLALKSELESEHQTKVLVLPVDLSRPGAAQQIFQATQDAQVQVDILINNAGFGGLGKFYEGDLDWYQRMVQVNVTALMDLSYLYGREMVKRGSGKILNVSSTAGFMPGPLQATYFATKAFVNSMSLAMSKELQGTGVTCTVLCPGFVNTEFAVAGNSQGLAGWKLAKSARSVAICGYEAMQSGKMQVFNEGLLKFVLLFLLPWVPNKILLKAVKAAMTKPGA